jgi:uncharacterized membrane protein YedE/YeeE
MPLLSAFVAGLLFGAGLLLSGMADPAKVLAFLDLAGRWDPSLLLVMAGAIGVGLLPFAYARRRPQSLLGLAMQLPASNRIDRNLLLGALLFGIGWGLAGICPGPALVLAGSGVGAGLLFAAAMLAGMALFEGWQRFLGRRQPGSGK